MCIYEDEKITLVKQLLFSLCRKLHRTKQAVKVPVNVKLCRIPPSHFTKAETAIEARLLKPPKRHGEALHCVQLVLGPPVPLRCDMWFNPRYPGSPFSVMSAPRITSPTTPWCPSQETTFSVMSAPRITSPTTPWRPSQETTLSVISCTYSTGWTSRSSQTH